MPRSTAWQASNSKLWVAFEADVLEVLGVEGHLEDAREGALRGQLGGARWPGK